MSQDQENLDLMQEGIDELEGSVDLKTALAQEKAKEKSDKEATKFAEKVKKNEERIAAKQAKLDEKALKAFEKESAKAEKLAIKNAPKPERISMNGIKLPSEHTSALAIWSLITSISNEKGEICKISDLKTVTAPTYIDKNGVEAFINPSNLSPELWAYKKFYGLTQSK